MKDASLRLQVMMSINHPEAFYRRVADDIGLDYDNLTHSEACTYRASLKAIEADILIEAAANNMVDLHNDQARRSLTAKIGDALVSEF